MDEHAEWPQTHSTYALIDQRVHTRIHAYTYCYRHFYFVSHKCARVGPRKHGVQIPHGNGNYEGEHLPGTAT